LVENFKVLATLQRRQHEANLALARLENRSTYSQTLVQQAVGLMRQMKTPAEVLAKALQILEANHVLVDSNAYVNIVLSITNNAGVMIGNGPATVTFVDQAVKYGNLIGLIPDHANKLQRELGTLASRVSGREGEAAMRRTREIKSTTPEFEGQSLEQINLVLLKVNYEVDQAREALDALYAEKF
jgi:hypothetical protein